MEFKLTYSTMVDWFFDGIEAGVASAYYLALYQWEQSQTRVEQSL